MNQGNIEFSGGGGGADANEGLAFQEDHVQLGQLQNTPGDPAMVHHNREIPMAYYNPAIYFGKNDGVSGAVGVAAGDLSVYKPASAGGPTLSMFDGANNVEMIYFGSQWALYFGGGYVLYDFAKQRIDFPSFLKTGIAFLSRPVFKMDFSQSPFDLDATMPGVGLLAVDTSGGNCSVYVDVDGLLSMNFKIAKVTPDAHTLTLAVAGGGLRFHDPVTGALVSSVVIAGGATKAYELFIDSVAGGNAFIV